MTALAFGAYCSVVLFLEAGVTAICVVVVSTISPLAARNDLLGTSCPFLSSNLPALPEATSSILTLPLLALDRLDDNVCLHFCICPIRFHSRNNVEVAAAAPKEVGYSQR